MYVRCVLLHCFINNSDAVATFSFEHCADSVEALKNVLMIYVDYSTVSTTSAY